MKTKQQEKSDTRPMHISLSYAMDDADSLLNRARQAEYDALDVDLNWPKMKLIATLAEAGDEGMSLTDLAKCCLRELSTVSSLLSKLERAGFVARTSGKKRERCRFLLTEQGRDLFSNRVRHTSSGMFFDTLSEEEQSELLALLQKLIANGKEMLGIDFIPKFLQ